MKTVAITGLCRGENPQPGASVAVSLRRRFPDLRIVGLSYDPLESALYAIDGSQPDAAYLMPYPGAGPDALRDRLDEILRREKLDLVLPCLDSEIANFIAIGADLRKRGVGAVLPSERALQSRSKASLYEFCQSLNIATPRTEQAHDPGTLAAIADAMGYPVYVKGNLYEAHLARSRSELYEAFAEIFGVWGGPVLVQECMVGEEYDVVGLGDGDGGVTATCAIRKMLRTSAGKGFAGVVVDSPALEDLVRRVIGALRWNGPFELEFIKSAQGPHVLFEMNPRFPSWVDFPSQIGCNLPARLIEAFFNMRPTPLRVCTPGQMFIRHSVDVVMDIGDVAQMAITGQRIDSGDEVNAELKVIA